MAPHKTTKWMRQKRPNDTLIDGRDTDFVVALMGPTGVGKSTFVNYVAGSDVTPVGHGLISCTQNIRHHIIDRHPLLPEGQRLVIVDTPGFDDTWVDDSEILRRIAVWLAASYHHDMKLGGLIYLYDISAKRLTGSVRLNMQMFEKLCGIRAFDRVIIGTTKWSPKIEAQAQARHKELQDVFWKELVDQGGVVRRIDHTPESCRAVLQELLNAARKNAQVAERALRIQQELVVEEKLVPRTEAGKLLKFSIEDMLSAKKQEMKELKENKSGDVEARQALQEEIDFLTGQLKDLRTGIIDRVLWRLRPA